MKKICQTFTPYPNKYNTYKSEPYIVKWNIKEYIANKICHCDNVVDQIDKLTEIVGRLMGVIADRIPDDTLAEILGLCGNEEIKEIIEEQII